MEDHGCLKRAVRLLDGPIEEWGSTEGTVSWCSEEFLLSENEASNNKFGGDTTGVPPVVGHFQVNLDFVVGLFSTLMIDGLVLAVSGVGST
ncbi:hypothetical protein LguiB_020807 [Lonicera macranthoides]